MQDDSRTEGGRRRGAGSEGFTLIELLIVVVIVAILAAIAIPQYADTKGQAYRSSMKSDLRNLSTSQEHYFAANNIYASSLADLQGETDYRPSDGVTVTIQSGLPNGWSATADHGGIPGSDDCGIHYGNASSPASRLSSSPGSTSLGVVFCAE